MELPLLDELPLSDELALTTEPTQAEPEAKKRSFEFK
jgi:hypothetical protein